MAQESKQIPRGPSHLYCPYWRKKMSAVCHTCPKWTEVKGQHPQNEKEEIGRWDCSDAFLPLMLIEIARRQIGTQRAVEQRGNSTVSMLAEAITRQERQHREALAMGGVQAPPTQKLVALKEGND